MNREKFKKSKPPILLRISSLALIYLFVYMENNPVVRIEAIMGFSPSPLEKYLGIKSLFSGMTEGVHQLARMNFISSLKANIFSPLFALVFVYLILFWKIPKVDTKHRELAFFSIVIILSLFVNIYN